MDQNNPPIILSLSALDPSGCEGLQSDIETSASLGCHCTTVATALCANGNIESSDTVAVDALLIIEQARSVLENMSIHAIKVGFTGSVANAEAIHSILSDYPQIPLILQPSLSLWNSSQKSQKDLPEAIASLLLPVAEMAVLSLEDIHTLARGCDTVDASAQYITGNGCQYALIHETSVTQRQTKSSLYQQNGLIAEYPWQHGLPIEPDNCTTLASAIAAFRAHDCPPQTAVEQAQNYTRQTLERARPLGFNKMTPYRFFWADRNEKKPSECKSPHNTH